MRKLPVLTFVSLNGVMQAPMELQEDTSGGFKHGGWAAKYYEEVMIQVADEAMAEPYDILFGRKTYELFAAHFLNVGKGPHADRFTNATKYVVTNTLDSLEWRNSVPITGNIPAEVSRLKAQDGPLLQVHGSSNLIQTLLANDLIDEFRLWTFPVVVGPGKRLFGEGIMRADFALVKTKSTANGIVMGIYRRAEA